MPLPAGNSEGRAEAGDAQLLELLPGNSELGEVGTLVLSVALHMDLEGRVRQQRQVGDEPYGAGSGAVNLEGKSIQPARLAFSAQIAHKRCRAKVQIAQGAEQHWGAEHDGAAAVAVLRATLGCGLGRVALGHQLREVGVVELQRILGPWAVETGAVKMALADGVRAGQCHDGLASQCMTWGTRSTLPHFHTSTGTCKRREPKH